MSKYTTKSYLLILEFFKKNKNTSLSVEEVYSFFLSKNIKISISTIYRTLEKLENENKIKKFFINNKKFAVFKFNDKENPCSSHFHFRCKNCEKLFHAECKELLSFLKHIKKLHYFNVDLSNSILYGNCSECIKKNINYKGKI